jgi:feruloyl esterase
MAAKVPFALAAAGAVISMCGWAAGAAVGNATEAAGTPAAVPTGRVASEDEARCAALARLALPNTEDFSASLQVAGTVVNGASYTAADRSTVGAEIAGLPEFCRVSGSIHPEPGSDIRFEVWMPSGDWNGRFMAVGNGGFAGSIRYKDMGDTLRAGYATASTDTGHDERKTPSRPPPRATRPSCATMAGGQST